MAHLYKAGLSSRTVKSYLSAVRHSQISMGLGDPRVEAMPQLEYVSRGMRKLSAGGPSTTRLPITPAILLQLRVVWSGLAVRRDAVMLWAAVCLCFFGFLRAGEALVPSDATYDPAVHLSHGDVRVDSTSDPQCIEVRIKSSKTDPFRKGVTVLLGRTNAALCPVAALLAYMVQRGSLPGPFFQFADGRVLTRVRLVSALHVALQEAGIDDSRFSGHSFRIGAATTAALQGVPDSLIKTMGRWESAAYQLYIRTPRETLCGVSRTLVH